MKIKKAILTVAIAIIFVLFIAYAIETFYPSPNYNDFCDTKSSEVIETQERCEALGGQWNPYSSARPVGVDGKEMVAEGYCDTDFTCREEHDKARSVYDRNIFFVSVILGLLVIVIAALLQLESVSGGLMGGGVILIIYGTIRYWGELSDVLRTIMLGLALVVLIWIGYKKIKD